MFPTIQNGEILFLQPISSKQVKIGDVISILRYNIYITHRVIEIIDNEYQKTTFILKGDNLKYPDPPVIIEDQEIYKVVALKRKYKDLFKVNSHKRLAWLSSYNLTYGIIRARIGRIVKRILRYNSEHQKKVVMKIKPTFFMKSLHLPFTRKREVKNGF
jgi:signal peptidase I